MIALAEIVGVGGGAGDGVVAPELGEGAGLEQLALEGVEPDRHARVVWLL
jgi:hypothetical protein